MLHSRDKRLAEQMKQALSSMFQKDVKDPRVPTIFTIIQVVMSKDTRTAKVYYSQLPDDDESLEKTREMLRDCGGFIRGKIAREVNLKFTPQIFFEYDPSSANYERINTKLNKLRKAGQMGTDEPAPETEDPENQA